METQRGGHDAGHARDGSAGALLRLNPVTGEIVWKKELTQVAGIKVPLWGFSSSPLVVGPLVVVYAGGAGVKGLLAFESASGELRWSVPCAENSYGSPQMNNLLGEDSLLMLASSGLLVLDPADGRTRLDYEWKIAQYRAVQPHVVGTDTVLLPTGMNMGTRAIRLRKDNGRYAAEELWTSYPNRDRWCWSPPIRADTANSPPSRRWKARPGTIRCLLATACTSAIPRRRPRIGCCEWKGTNARKDIARTPRLAP